VGHGQSVNDSIPRTLKPVQGGETIADHDRVFAQLRHGRLAPASKLLAVFDLGPDGKRMITGWTDEPAPYKWTHHFQVFRQAGSRQPAFLGEFTLSDGPSFTIRLYRPPDARDQPKIVFDIAGGGAWGTTYLLDSSGRTVTKLFAPNAYDFVDLDGDGVYEAVAWNRRPNDERCKFGLLAERVNPEIYVRSAATYRKAWPPASWTRQEVMALLADMDGDGATEIVSLVDDWRSGPASQNVIVYRYRRGVFTQLAATPLPWPKIAFMLADIRTLEGAPAVRVRLATAARCDAGDNPDAGSGISEAAYAFRGGRLQRVALH
jgi:hypothetical protein